MVSFLSAISDACLGWGPPVTHASGALALPCRFRGGDFLSYRQNLAFSPFHQDVPCGRFKYFDQDLLLFLEGTRSGV